MGGIDPSRSTVGIRMDVGTKGETIYLVISVSKVVNTVPVETPR